MKKHAIVTMTLAIALAMPAITSAGPMSDFAAESSEKEYTFRGIPWGASVDEIENSDFLIEYPDYEYDKDLNKIFVYNVEVAEKSASAVLSLDDGGLSGAMYLMEENHDILFDYYQDYLDLEKSLVKKYGRPDNKIDNWEDDFYKNDPSLYDFAVGAGDVTFIRTWNGNNSSISLMCSGGDLKISNIIFYNSDSFKSLERKDDGL